MLVFRRAISLLLSLVLVFAPSLALGRKGTQSHKFEAQETEAFKKSWAKHEARETAKKRKIAAAQAAASTRGPFKSQRAAIESVFKSLKINGEPYSYSSIAGPNGTNKAQIISGKDIQNILVDEYNTGTASRWEIKKSDTKIVADQPYEGHFSHIQITQPRAKSILKIDLQMNPDLKTYRLASVKLDAYKVDHEVNAMCISDLQDPAKASIASMTTFLEQVEKAKSPSTTETALTCRMLHHQKMIFDKSCYEGEFANSVDDMARAYAKVFGTQGTTAPPRMLQCVERLGFAGQSAQMQAEFMRVQENVRIEMQINANWSRDQIDNDSDCTRMTKIPQWDGKKWVDDRIDVDKFIVQMPKTIKCDAGLPQNEAGRTVNGVVVIGKSSSWMAQRRGGGSAVDGYAALFLHELMHKTGLPEDPYESLIGNVQQCCADPSIQTQAAFDANPACKEAADYAKDDIEQQRYRSELNIYYPGYSQIYDNLQDRLQTGSRNNPSAKRFLADWRTALIADRRAGPALEELLRCEKANPTNTKPCIDKAFDALKDFNNAYMGNQCKAGVRSGLYSGIDCDDIRSMFRTALGERKSAVTVIGDRQVPIEEKIPRLPIAITEAPLIVPELNPADIANLIPPLPTLEQPTETPVRGQTLARTSGTNARAANSNRVAATRPQTQRTPVIDPVMGALPLPMSTAEANRQERIRIANPGIQRPETSVAATTQPATQSATQPRTVVSNGGNTNSNNNAAPNNSGTVNGNTNVRGPVTIGGTGATNSPPTDSNNGSALPPSETGNTNADGSTVNPPADPNASPIDPAYAGSSATSPLNIGASTNRSATTPLRMGANNAGSNILANGSANAGASYTAGAAPVAGALINAGNRIATNLTNYASNVAGQFEGTAYANATAPRPVVSNRLPANVGTSAGRYASASVGGSRLIPSMLRASASTAGGSDEPSKPGAPAANAPAEAGPRNEPETNDRQAAPQTRQAINQRADVEIDNFQGRSFAKPNDVVIALVRLSPDTMAREMARGESSELMNKLRPLGWSMTMSRKSRIRILKSPTGRCFAPGQRSGVTPLDSCG